MNKLLIPFFALLLLLPSCDLFDEDEQDPNVISGSTDVEWAQPGTKFYLSFDTKDASQSDKELLDIIDDIEQETQIITNDDGIVTTRVRFTMNERQVLAIDTLLGVQDMTVPSKLILLDIVLNTLPNVVLDTSDMENIIFGFDAISKVTSEGIQTYPTDDLTKPFTVVKYDCKVGDTYKFTRDDGEVITRKVVSKSTKDEYEWGLWLLKVIKTEETNSYPLVDKVVHITNHKYGLVGLEMHLSSGKKFSIVVI